MGYKQIRVGQLIAPFGTGSIYTDRNGFPHIVGGLDHWYKKRDNVSGEMVLCSEPDEFEIFENRISDLLKIDRFKTPPDFRQVSRGHTPPPNASLSIPALRFPRWHRNTRTGKLQRFNLNTTRLSPPTDGGRWQPVRFISVCSAGHIGDFPWKEWLKCECQGDGDLFLTDLGGSDLTTIKLVCKSCPDGSMGRKGKTLANTTRIPVGNDELSAFKSAGINCKGDRPWLGEGGYEVGCDQPLIGALINQTNLYFPRVFSAISLPDLEIMNEEFIKLKNEIEEDSTLGMNKSVWNQGNKDLAVDMMKSVLGRRNINPPGELILSVLESIFKNRVNSHSSEKTSPSEPESDLLDFRRQEFNIIRNEVNDSKNISDLRVIKAGVPDKLKPWIQGINLVERLKETRVFFGFDRLIPTPNPISEMPEIALNQLFLNPPETRMDRWLPAVKVFGEGLYFELDEDRITEWQRTNKEWLMRRIDEGFISRLSEEFLVLSPNTVAEIEWASRYLLIHSLSHILINQLIFECGYSTASVRERLYISSDSKAPMSGILIYTSAGDSEGTLGGLVSLGRPERIGDIFLNALSRASWCSSDPVCSEPHGARGSRLVNLAACHACTLLPETSCETINNGLDRAMIVGTPYDRSRGFMSDLVNEKNIF